MKGSVDSIETMGLVDGPGIRTVVFLSGCHLRCKYCHNPEMWDKRKNNHTSDELVEKIIRNKPYFKDEGGVTFSGGEPLLQHEFLLDCCKKLKKEGIHIALDTAGIGNGNYEEILKYVDLVLLDVKHITKEGFKDITRRDYLDKYFEFLKVLNKSNKDVWIRQVIVPGIMDNEEYMDGLRDFIKNNIKNVKRIEFLPFHRLGREKYIKLNLPYIYEDKQDMDQEKTSKLYDYFMKDY